jgi:hypothetical protein
VLAFRSILPSLRRGGGRRREMGAIPTDRARTIRPDPKPGPGFCEIQPAPASAA